MADNVHETTIHRELALRTQVAISIVSVFGAALASVTTIVADFAIRLDRLSVCGGSLLVVGGLVASSFAANLGICTRSRHEKVSRLLATAAALLPAILMGISRSQWNRALIVFSMVMAGWLGGWTVSRKLFLVARAHGVISQLRLALAIIFVTFGAFVYVIAPSLEIVGK